MSCLSPKKGFCFVSMFVGSRVRQLPMWIGRQIKADSLLDDWIILLTLTIFKSTLEGVVCELLCWANLSLGLVQTSPIQQAFHHFPAPRLIGFVLVQIFQTGKSWTIAVNPLAVVTSDPWFLPSTVSTCGLRIAFLWLAPRWLVKLLFNQGKQFSKASKLYKIRSLANMFRVFWNGFFCVSFIAGQTSTSLMRLCPLLALVSKAPCLHDMKTRYPISSFKTRKCYIRWGAQRCSKRFRWIQGIFCWLPNLLAIDQNGNPITPTEVLFFLVIWAAVVWRIFSTIAIVLPPFTRRFVATIRWRGIAH